MRARQNKYYKGKKKERKKIKYMQKFSVHSKSGCSADLQAKERGVKYKMLLKNV